MPMEEVAISSVKTTGVDIKTSTRLRKLCLHAKFEERLLDNGTRLKDALGSALPEEREGVLLFLEEETTESEAIQDRLVDFVSFFYEKNSKQVEISSKDMKNLLSRLWPIYQTGPDIFRDVMAGGREKTATEDGLDSHLISYAQNTSQYEHGTDDLVTEVATNSSCFTNTFACIRSTLNRLMSFGGSQNHKGRASNASSFGSIDGSFGR